MKAWHLPLLVVEGVLALAVTYCGGEARTQCGSVARATSATLVVRDDDGRTTHAHMVRPNVQITLNGEPTRLENLRVGDRVSVSLAQEDGTNVVQSIAAQSADHRLSSLPTAELNSAAAGPLANVGAFE
jgi:hypothetical protein